jgi:hypothetical protein
MARTMTNNFGLAYAEETTFGTVPTTGWTKLQPNSLSTMGRSITTVSRDPISKERQREKGTVTDLDSAVEFEADLTREDFTDFSEAFVFANNTDAMLNSSTTTDVDATTGYAGTFTETLVVGSLIFARGFAESANNGLQVVDTEVDYSTDIPVTGTLVTEGTSPSNATIESCGFRTASGDLEVANVSGTNADLTSTALDFTTLGLTVGQFIWIGGDAAGNQFTEQAGSDTNYGFARITSIAANTLGIDKMRSTFTATTNTTQAVDIYFGQWLRNLDVDDADYIERSYTFEGAFKDLGGAGTDEYEYAKGNYCNSMAINMPLTDKATVTWGFIGTDTDDPTTTRATGASSAVDPVQTTAYNTSSDFARLRLTQEDETGLTTDFKDMTITLNNNVSPEKVLDTLGAKYMNTGNLEVDISTTVLFSNSAVVDAIRANTTVTMEMALRNDDGAFLIDIPEMTIGDGTKDFPVNESVTLALNCMAHKDETYGISIGISQFPYIPSV